MVSARLKMAGDGPASASSLPGAVERVDSKSLILGEREVKRAARKTNCRNFTKNGVIHTFRGYIMSK